MTTCIKHGSLWPPTLNLDHIHCEAAYTVSVLEQTGALRKAEQRITALLNSRSSTLALISPAINQEGSAQEILWKELAITGASDDRTFIHSLGVTRILYEMQTDEQGAMHTYLTRTLGHQAFVSNGTLYIAGLLHDIGKRIIREIIHDQRTKREWATLANQVTGQEIFHPLAIQSVHDGGLGDAELDDYFHEIGQDPIDIVPLKYAFPQEVTEKLHQRGISPELTFRQAIELHEVGTYYLLRHYPGMEQLAEIAAWHHNFKNVPVEQEAYPAASTALRIAVNQCLHLADMFEALVSGFRSYKGRFHPLVALPIVAREAEKHSIDTGFIRAFVQDRVAHLKAWCDSPPPLIAAQRSIEELCAA